MKTYFGETMKLDELIKQISDKTGNIINQSALAESLGITRQTVSNRIKNESEVTVSELNRIEEYFKIFDEYAKEHFKIMVKLMDLFKKYYNM